ncbi:MAG TPA: shikimate kinase, partial [Chthoniobacterales bacterium]|nr:shikimate kinase [Chthoniobacterales bacterium]
MIANRFGLSISEIFEAHGEEKFREAETEALRQLAGKGQSIIVTGGGIVLRPENVTLLGELGTIFYLSA